MRKATKEGELIQAKRDITPQEEEFARLVASGSSIADAYYQSGHKAKNRTSARVHGWQITQKPHVAEYLAHLREIQYKAEALSKEEKRLFLAGLVRCKPSDLSPDSLYASAVIGEDGEMRLSGPKLSDKVAAVKEDGEIIGDKASNGLPSISNPMIFIRLAESEKLAHASLPQEAIEADITGD